MAKQQRSYQKEVPLTDAFRSMIEQEGIWDRLKVGRQTVLNRRVMVRNSEFPKDSTMRAWLKKAGWKMAVEERWKR